MVTQRSQLSLEQIAELCRRGFGPQAQIKSAVELDGGTINSTFRIEFLDEPPVVLRVAPSPGNRVPRDEVALMRREHAIQPFFASIATLIPRILLADFTHQLVDRDYMFQSYIDGERWEEVEDELGPDANRTLWHQFGSILRRIHDTSGDYFGWPPPRLQYGSWTELIVDRFEMVIADLSAAELDVTSFAEVLQLVRSRAFVLDSVQSPRLLHGDLWTFNLLITRGERLPTIVGVLDVERAWWGDPLADWTSFLLAIREESPEWAEPLHAFRETYGPLVRDEAERLRRDIYNVMHLGSVAEWSLRNKKAGDTARAIREAGEIADALSVRLGP